jgi:hypothetical protein
MQKPAHWVDGEESLPTTRLTLEDLPPRNVGRWVPRRKAQVVMAVRHGVLSVQQALDRWNLSEEEFQTWEGLIDRYGELGLRTTRIQQFRHRESA